MLHAVILGLVIAIVLIFLIQKTTSGFTAAECDAQYTLAYKACGAAYDKTKKECSGSNQEGCRTKALHVRQACQDAAQAAKKACMGEASAGGDNVATMKLDQESKTAVRIRSQTAVEARTLVTPGAAFTAPSPTPR